MIRGVPVGYAVVDTLHNKLSCVVCPWWTYPFIRPYYWARWKKYDMYRWLNQKGVMESDEEEEIMTWRDLKLIKKWRRRND